jgi:hypothetical protein
MKASLLKPTNSPTSTATPYRRIIDIDLLVEEFLKDVEGLIRRHYEG